ncbi:MAG: Holliday junction resolvase Hjc [Methanosphaera sp.]|uniref:Holliday junction resolvase Hjc n=1 Tax=Methanosphaera sp. TaxID=2666342 RepID=UPI0025ED1DC7|nr:Holliday junction resolvase Hjc [Methanosphaera sp.]MCI5866910.1 Holliday junction resolvase [Methanosphaera sp.]MDD6534417.1 Holliday junction resolvase Hjc [Methanosphaera sp.]MDY3955178.1 Holliday junction resolvase Hjc [Methanosphaera sp.]
MSKTGSKEERDLVNMLWDVGFAAMRAPASGGATKRPLPDVLAGNGELYLAIEVKSSRLEHIYIDNEKITNLKEFSKIFGSKSYIGAKFIRKPWRFIKLEDLHITPSNNYRVNQELAFTKGIDFDEMIEESKQTKLL